MNRILALSFLAVLLNVSSVYSQSRISRQAAIADIDTLVATLERVHYNPYLHISKQDFDRNLDEIRQSVTDSISFNDFLLLLYRITGSLEDGHGMPAIVQPELLAELRKPSFLVLRFIPEAGEFYLPGSDYGMTGIPYEARIQSVNGISLGEAFSEFQSFFGGALNFKKEMATRLMGYFLFLKGARPPFKFVYATGEKKKEILVFPKGVTFMEMLQRTMPQIRQKNSYTIYEDKIAWLNYVSMNGDFNQWGSFLDSFFTDIRLRKVSTLCIDIRNNSGGNSLFNNFLLAYITKKKFLQSGGKSWRISNDYKQHQRNDGIDNSDYQSKETGTVWTYENCNPQENLVIADSIFHGKIYLVTGAFSFSSANMLADAFKTFKLGTIIGEPTGEYTNDFGEVMPIVLPHSKVALQLTTSFETGADCNKQDFHTVTPDIIVVHKLSDKIAMKDSVMEYILEEAGH